MAKKKIEKIESDYTRNELEFLSMMNTKEPVIAIVSENDERRNDAVNWLAEKLNNEDYVTGVSLNTHDSEFLKEMDPDILIGDSLKSLSALLGEKPLPLSGNRGYIYFSRSTKVSDIKEWLGIDNNGQHLVDTWVRLNKN